MKNRVRTALLTLYMMFILLPVITLEADASTPGFGTCGANVIWNLDEAGTLTISGTGDMENYTLNDAHSPWYSVRTNVIAVKIEDGVTSIGAYAFYGCRNLTTISIPDGITEIGEYAFYDCRSIADIMIPAGIVRIGSVAFWGCSSLKNMVVPDSVTNIGNSAFHGCSGLTAIQLSNALTSIEYNTFIGCSSLETIDIPDSVSSIGYNAFESCTSLRSIVIPHSVTKIGSMAFSGCSALTYVNIPGSVTTIGDWAFSGCTGLKSAGPSGGGYSYEFGWTNAIPAFAFHVCSGLTKVVIPTPISVIGNNAFKGCSKVESVYIPSTVSSIGGYAFSSWNNLKDIYYGGTEEQWGAIAVGRDNEALSRATIHYNSEQPGIALHRVYRAYDDDPGYPTGYEVFDVSVEQCIASSLPTEYNPQLAHMLISMCNSVYSDINMERTFESFGFDNDPVIEHKAFINYAVARKQKDDGSSLVLVVVRGTGKLSILPGNDLGSWASNVEGYLEKNDRGEHKGYSDAAGEIYRTLHQISTSSADFANATYVITGFSRGAATANILAAWLLDEGITSVYCYGFACPDTVTSDNYASHRYDCIFNISDIDDFFSWTPSVSIQTGFLEWQKYGQSRWYMHVWDNYTNLQMNTTVHNQKMYMDYLRDEKEINEYKNGNTAHQILNEATARRVAEESKKYFHGSYRGRIRRFSQHCPVDIEVYNAIGQLAGSVIGGEVTINLPDDVYVYAVQDEKFVYLLKVGNYNIQMIGTDAGMMAYMIEDVDMETWRALEAKRFEKVELAPGKKFVSSIDVQDTTGTGTKVEEVPLYVLGASAEPERSVLADGKGTEVPLLHLTADAAGGLRGATALQLPDNSAEIGKLHGYVAAYDSDGRFRGIEKGVISSDGQQGLLLELQGGLRAENGVGPVLKVFVVDNSLAPVCSVDTVQAIVEENH